VANAKCDARASIPQKTKLYNRQGLCELADAMRLIKHFLFLLSAPLLFVGCSSITNLTPSEQPRNATGLYPIEAAWDSRQQSIRPESFKPVVLVGMESYPMRKTALMKDRWETLVPIPPEKNSIHYRFKFDFEYNSIPTPKPDSKLSPEYKLQIFDKPSVK
jgi:hypothetical protein